MNLKKWFNKIVKEGDHKSHTDKKNIVNLAIVFLVGVLIVSAVSIFGGYGKNTSSSEISSDNSQNNSAVNSGIGQNSSGQSGSGSETSGNTSSDYEKSVQEN